MGVPSLRAALAVLAVLAAGPARAQDGAPEEAPVTAPAKERRPNRLAQESSPYLLQHAHNPVDWYPWGEEAFAAARRSDRPVFLSIGYSTCHWCHVMERESFESEEIAAFLNAHFVSIKVDREERPDVDSVYMTAVQATGQGGGWPLTAFLDHERRPFFLGTYFPPEDRWGRPGFPTVLRKIAQAWKEKREDVGKAGEELAGLVRGAFDAPPPAEVGAATVAAAVSQFRARYDEARGGFGDAPKFPRAHALSFLLQAGGRAEDGKAREMALGTLRAMARGGLHDHVGGGFHRYSTDGAWLVPHFEKMLYDQALLARACVEAWQATDDGEFARVARDTLDYVLRDLRHPKGGLFCAEDADSEGVEGKFYLWTTKDLREALGEEEGVAAARVFGARDGGNFHGEAEEAPAGANILHLPSPPDVPQERIDRWRARLLEVRARRVRPHLDDKVLASWNGLGISALARAGRALGEPRYLEAAARAADFVLGTMRGPDGGLLRSWREGRSGGPGHLEDHAFLGLGILDLYEAGGEPKRLEQALALAREIPRRFADPAGGAFFDAPAGSKDLLARTRETEDWAIPSGNSVAVLLLLRAGRIAGDPALEDAGRGALRAVSGALARLPMGSPSMLAALDFDLGPSREVTLAGDPADPAFRALERAVAGRFLPRTVTIRRPAGPGDGKPSATVCVKGACKPPVTTPEELVPLLEE